MKLRTFLAALGGALALGLGSAPLLAQTAPAQPGIWNKIAICDYVNPANCAKPDASGNLPMTLGAGTAILGKVGIDQTTPGTTNGVQVNAALPAGTNLIGKAGIDQTTPGTTNGVQITATTAVAPVVSATAESNHVLKGSAGSLLSVSTTAGATAGFMLIFDATVAPGDGAVTPKYCIQVPANNFASATWPVPATFATGITVVFSTSGCFTQALSATAFFSGQVR